jgi:3-oxoacyl-[acyl-carrier protein] reductase
MIRGGGARIIYTSSITGVQSTAGGAAYGGAKTALNILTNIVHQELANDRIRTVAISPGSPTPRHARDHHQDHIERVAAAYPGGRLGQPEDIVALTIFLCSDGASHISGTAVTVRPPVTG